MGLKEVRIPATNKGPWHEAGDEVLIVRIGKDTWRIGEGLGKGETKKGGVTGGVGKPVQVIVTNTPIPGQTDYGDMLYVFEDEDWQRVFELDIVSP